MMIDEIPEMLLFIHTEAAKACADQLYLEAVTASGNPHLVDLDCVESAMRSGFDAVNRRKGIEVDSLLSARMWCRTYTAFTERYCQLLASPSHEGGCA